MSYIEAKKKINEIKDATAGFQGEVNKVQSQLMELSSEVGNVTTAINSDLHEETIASYSASAGSQIANKINAALSKSSSALSGLSQDATNEIKKIVDAHNASIDYESENPEPRLSYETISLSSIAGCPDESSDSSPKNTNPRPTGSSSSNRKDLDYYLSQLASKGFKSQDIEGWNDYVNSFLRENNLDKAIKSITVNGKTVKCILSNGKEYTFTNVTSTIDLLRALQAAIEKENQNA